jgi:hypothetical protein
MVSWGRFCEENRVPHTKTCLFGAGASKGARRPFPRLRRKRGLCYTADANSPFEAYINVR